MENPQQLNNLEVLPPSAVGSLERAAIDCQVATAHAYPRSLEQFKKRATGMATLDLQTAESCIYCRPVGGGKVAEGASIRMAEIVASAFGNLRVASRIVEQTERYVKCEGVAHDLESNYAGKSEVMEPTVMKSGQPYSESQRAVVAKACLAKAYRDAVFKVVPQALCKSIVMAARGVINKEVATIEQRQARVKDWLKQIRVEDARVFGVLGVQGWSEVTDEHLTMLTGLRTAINEGDTTMEDAFPTAAKSPDFGGRPGAPAPARRVVVSTSQPAKVAQASPPRATGSPQNAGLRTQEQPSGPLQEDVTEFSGPSSEVLKRRKLPVEAQEQPPQEPSRMPQDGSEGVETASEPQNEQDGAAESGNPPSDASPEGESPVVEAEASPITAQAQLAEIVGSILYQAAQAGVTQSQIMSWCLKKRVARDGQTKLSELSSTKLKTINKGFKNNVQEIKAEAK